VLWVLGVGVWGVRRVIRVDFLKNITTPLQAPP
jgi:hypothetical protein